MVLRAALTLVVLTFGVGCTWAKNFLNANPAPLDLDYLNQHVLKGQIDDYTANHGRDNRICSNALGEKRDLYVYKPVGYDPKNKYPVVFWFHGFAQDEKDFLEVVHHFDKAMNDGKLPKCVIACPDGSSRGRASFLDAGTLYLNSRLGKYEDFIMKDVWAFVFANYSLQPNKEAHVFAGVSMGGFGAYNLGIKYRNDIGMLIGIMSPLHLRYADCQGNTDTNFDPYNLGINDTYRPLAPIGRLDSTILTIRQRRVIAPVFGEDRDVIAKIATDNPAEMLKLYGVKPGEQQMFAGFGECDELNFDAQTLAFQHIAKNDHQIDMKVIMVPNGKHNRDTAIRMLDPLADWASPLLQKYAPK
ncbi:MAG: alpha/beta hydrolase-fold protein [Zavarzinella sp.]